MSAQGVTKDKIIGFALKDPDSKGRIMRWHIMAGLCLLHGYRKGAEVGVSQGRFTMFLCAAMHEMQMTCVDRWEEQPDNKGEGAEQYVGWKHNEFLERFKGICADYFPNRVRIMRMDSVDGAKMIEDESLDFVFIDDDHSFEGATRSINAWYLKVRKGGIVAGHDYDWPTVQQAVTAQGWEQVVLFSDSVWVHPKK